MVCVGRWWFILILMMAALASGGARATEMFPAPLAAELARLVEADRVALDVPGMAVCLVNREGVLFRHFSGFADTARSLPVGPETRFRLASMSKIFTSIAILRLVDAGRVRLDEPIRTLLPWFRFADDRAPAITVRHILLHLAGLPREVPGASWVDRIMPDRDALIRDLPRMRAALPPETQWKYSNLGYALLGLVIEAAGGKPYDEMVGDEIGRALGIGGLVPKGASDDLAVGYGERDGGVRTARPYLATGALTPAAGLAARCDDLAQVLRFLLTGQPAGILSEASRRALLLPHHVFPDFTYAEGYGLNFRPVGGRSRIGHAGRALGYAGRLELDPVAGLGVVVLTNADENGPTRLADRVLATAIAGLPIRTMPDAIADPAWARLVGAYQDRGHGIGIAVIAGRLTWMDGADPARARAKITLSPVSGTDGTGFTFDSGALVGEMLSFELDPATGNVLGMRAADGSRAVRVP